VDIAGSRSGRSGDQAAESRSSLPEHSCSEGFNRLRLGPQPGAVKRVEFNMKSRFLLGVAAPALAALAFVSSAGPASAQYYGYPGFGWGAAGLAAGIVGGALAVATAPLWAPGYYGYSSYYPTYPGYGYSPGYS
jgi:hypothetical protein